MTGEENGTSKMSAQRPGRPTVVSVGVCSAELRWTVPTGEPRPLGFCISAQAGGAGDWAILITDTHSEAGHAVVDTLEPETWYSFRVAAIDPDSGGAQPYGSAPSKPIKTMPPNPWLEQLKPAAPMVRSSTNGELIDVGRTVAAAAMVARGVETAPPLTEEESATASRAAAQALEAARLRKELCEFDICFEASHGHFASDAERAGSRTRSEALRRYTQLVRERLALGDDLVDELAPIGTYAVSSTAAVRVPSVVQPTAASVPRARLTAAAEGGAMAIEQRILATRHQNTARHLYGIMLTAHCSSLAHIDSLTPLSGAQLEGAVRLFAAFDTSVSALLGPEDFPPLYAALNTFLAHARSASGGDGDAGAPSAGADAVVANPFAERKGDWHTAFRRADLNGDGKVDLNELVHYLQGRDALPMVELSRASSSMHASTFHLCVHAAHEYAASPVHAAEVAHGGAANTERFGHLSLVPAADSALLADEIYLTKLVEQARSVGSQFDLDQLPDHRLLLRALRLFRRYDHQQCGTLERTDFVLMLAPALERAFVARAHAPDTPSRAAAASAAASNAATLAKSKGAQAILSDAYTRLAIRAAEKPGMPREILSSPQEILSSPPAGSREILSSPPAGSREILSSPPAGSREILSSPPAGSREKGASKGIVPPSTAPSTDGVVERLRSGNEAVEAAQALFVYADTDGNGHVDFNEFVRLLTSGIVPRVAEGASLEPRRAASSSGKRLAAAAAPSLSPEMACMIMSAAAVAMTNPTSAVSSTAADQTSTAALNEAHRAKMIERCLERLGGDASGARVLLRVVDSASSAAVECFARADRDETGSLDLAEFEEALKTAHESGLTSHAKFLCGSSRRPIGPMEARLWFAAIASTGRVDICAWLELLYGPVADGEVAVMEGEGAMRDAQRVRARDKHKTTRRAKASGRRRQRQGATIAGIVAGSSTGTGDEADEDERYQSSLWSSDFSPWFERIKTKRESGLRGKAAAAVFGASAAGALTSSVSAREKALREQQQRATATLDLLEPLEPPEPLGTAPDPLVTAPMVRDPAPGAFHISPQPTLEMPRVRYGAPARARARPPRYTNAAEAAEDAQAEAIAVERARERAQIGEVEDERLHAYLAKLVSQAASAKLSREGAATLASLSSDHLSCALALYERFDADGDGRLQPDEFARLLGLISRQNGVRFSTKEVDRLFETADLANAGSLDVLEVLLLLEQLGLQPEAPAELEAYRTRVLHEAARSMVKLESAAAEHRRQTAKTPHANGFHSERAGAVLARGSVLKAPEEKMEECMLLLRRYDRGRKGFLEFDEFCALVTNVAVEAGGRPPTHTESQLLWERADTDHSGTIDLNELYLHLMAANPFAKTADPWLLLATGGGVEGAAVNDGSAPANVSSELPSELPLCSPAAAQAAAVRHRRVAALLTSASPFLEKVAGTAAPFGRAELRSLAHLFDDLDTDGDGALTLAEFVVLLALLAERAASTALKPGASTAHGPKSAPVRRAASSTIGMREAHAIYQQRGLEPSQTLSFVGFLELLAVDERTPIVSKPTAQSSSRARSGSNREQRAVSRGSSTEKQQLQQQVQPQRDRRRRRRDKWDLAAPQVDARGGGGLI